jgi:acetylornithine/N-succinyldiaminopimelate aminotransferase
MTANENVVRLLPALIVTEADIEDAVGRLARVFERIEAEAQAAPATADA